MATREKKTMLTGNLAREAHKVVGAVEAQNEYREQGVPCEELDNQVDAIVEGFFNIAVLGEIVDCDTADIELEETDSGAFVVYLIEQINC